MKIPETIFSRAENLMNEIAIFTESVVWSRWGKSFARSGLVSRMSEPYFARKECPVNIDIRSFVQLVYQKDYVGAVNKIRESNYLPAICGRVCPQEEQCEQVCHTRQKAWSRSDRKAWTLRCRMNWSIDFFPPVIQEHRSEKIGDRWFGSCWFDMCCWVGKTRLSSYYLEALQLLAGSEVPVFRNSSSTYYFFDLEPAVSRR